MTPSHDVNTPMNKKDSIYLIIIREPLSRVGFMFPLSRPKSDLHVIMNLITFFKRIQVCKACRVLYKNMPDLHGRLECMGHGEALAGSCAMVNAHTQKRL